MWLPNTPAHELAISVLTVTTFTTCCQLMALDRYLLLPLPLTLIHHG